MLTLCGLNNKIETARESCTDWLLCIIVISVHFCTSLCVYSMWNVWSFLVPKYLTGDVLMLQPMELFYVGRNLKQSQVTQSDKFKQYADDSLLWTCSNWPQPLLTATVTVHFRVCFNKEKNVVENINIMSHIRVHVKLKTILRTSSSTTGQRLTNWNHLPSPFVYNTLIVTLVTRWRRSIRLLKSRWLIFLEIQVVKPN